MKKLILTIITLFTFSIAVNAQKSIAFTKGTLSEVLAQAKKENKLVFIDCYTSWCGPCKMMEKYVFTNDTVANFFNKTFINYKLDMEKGEGIGVAAEYRVGSYPTYLFLDGTGKQIHRSANRMPVVEFMAEAQKASNPAETSFAMEERYAAGERNPEFMVKYIDQLKKGNINKAKRIFQETLATVSDDVLKTNIGWEIMTMFPLTEEDRFYKFLTANEAYFVAKQGKEEVKAIQRQIELNALYRALGKKEKEELFKRLAAYRQGADAAMLGTAAKIEILYYLNTKDYPTFIKLAKQYCASVLKTDDNVLSFIAHRCELDTDDKEVLKQALAMAEQAIKINDKVYVNQRSYADLCYKLGMKDEALKAAQLAYNIVNDENPKAGKLTAELIEKIKVM
jgi:thioredoxin-related protein